MTWYRRQNHSSPHPNLENKNTQIDPDASVHPRTSWRNRNQRLPVLGHQHAAQSAGDWSWNSWDPGQRWWVGKCRKFSWENHRQELWTSLGIFKPGQLVPHHPFHFGFYEGEAGRILSFWKLILSVLAHWRPFMSIAGLVCMNSPFGGFLK